MQAPPPFSLGVGAPVNKHETRKHAFDQEKKKKKKQ